MPTVITAGDSVSAASSLVGGNDGTLNIVVGPAGAKVTALSVAIDGTPTFIKQPVVPVQSMVRLNTANGYGSTNTVIRRFTTVISTQGSDITYADSATLGGTFTINVNGVYAISYSDSFSVGSGMGISVNSSQLTTGIGGINVTDRLMDVSTSAGSSVTEASTTAYLTVGSIVRAHATGDTNGAALARTQFTITRVA